MWRFVFECYKFEERRFKWGRDRTGYYYLELGKRTYTVQVITSV